MRITSKGQVTIPQAVREKHGFLPGTEVAFVMKKGIVHLEKVGGSERRGQALIEGLRGRASTVMTTEEILALTRGSD